MKSIEVSGKNVDQAIEIGLFKLQTTKDKVKIAVLSEGGLFSKAKIRMSIYEESDAENEALKTLENIIGLMNLKCDCFLQETEDEYKINVSGEDVGYLIGRRGDVLDAVQYLVSLIVNKDKKDGEYKKVVIDSEGYRDKRIETLKALANRLAGKAVREGKVVKLEPMNPSERRVIHSELQNFDGITTESKGEEPKRFINIIPNKKKGKSPVYTSGKEYFVNEKESGEGAGIRSQRDYND